MAFDQGFAGIKAAGGEGIISNTDNAITNRDARQTEALSESLISDADDAIR